MDDKVQLSRETIVGDSVVNEDIYPNTNTVSVNDDQSGTSLNETIERIWAAINNKLARNVNSVNGRSGIVVLDSSDVGLENVDNVSFNDIKSWVIDELTKVFGYKQIKLFHDKSGLDVCLAAHNMDDLYAPFYVETWDTIDTRPYIGCIILGDDSESLRYIALPINGIGMTDESLIYKNAIDDVDHPDMKTGELRVKISSEEDALYVERSSDEYEKNGLKIDKSMIGGVLHFYDGIYGEVDGTTETGQVNYEGGLLSPYARDPETEESHPTCTIYVDGNELGNDFYLNHTESKPSGIHKNDTIVCNFKDYRTSDGPLYTLNSEKEYIEIVRNDGRPTFPHSGDRYRVGDIIDIDDPQLKIKFTVTAIAGGKFEGPASAVDLLYCEPFDDTLKPEIPVDGKLYPTKPILRYKSPCDVNSGFPKPVDLGGDSYISINNTSTADGLQIFIKDDTYFIHAQYQEPEGTEFKLMKRGMCIGRVLSAPNRIDSDLPYIIEFNSIRPLIGNSLQFKTYDEQFHSDKFSDVIDVKTRKGHFNANGVINDPIDISGLAIAENWGEYREDGKSARIVDSAGDSLVEPNRMKRVAVLPGGVTNVMSNSQNSSGGLTVMTDMSLCLIPHTICSPSSGYSGYSQYAVNWHAALPYTYPTYEKDVPSYVGVNTFKVVKQWNRYGMRTASDPYENRKYLINMSGLRIVDASTKINHEMFGKLDTNEMYINSTDELSNETMESLPTSGGLMVNVGAGLEIRGVYYENEDDKGTILPFDDSGKVCVRVDDKTIEINEQNRLQIKVGKGLITDTTDPENGNLMLNVDPSFTFTEDTTAPKLSLNVNTETYHDIDMMSNLHPVVNLIKTATPTGKFVPLSAYVNTKYGLGLGISGNQTWSSDGTEDTSTPNALIIRIKASDVGDSSSVYRQKLVGLKNDSLMFDPDGKLISPIDTSKGLTNTYVAKAMSADSNGNVTVTQQGGIAINIGAGLAFDKDGKLTLEADYEIKKLKNGFDLNNLTVGNYYAAADVTDSIENRPTNGLGVFRIEHVVVIPDSYYIQKLYSMEKKGIVYMRYKSNGTWTGWYHIDGSIID